MYYETEIHPIKRRRDAIGLSQEEMAKRLGITQSQYSRVETLKTDPEKYLPKLAEIFGCKPEEVCGREIWKEIQDEFFNNRSQKSYRQFDERRLDSVYLDVRGWFSRQQLKELIRDINIGFEEIKAWKEEQESDEFKQRVAEALDNWDGKSPAVEMPPKKGEKR